MFVKFSNVDIPISQIRGWRKADSERCYSIVFEIDCERSDDSLCALTLTESFKTAAERDLRFSIVNRDIINAAKPTFFKPHYGDS